MPSVIKVKIHKQFEVTILADDAEEVKRSLEKNAMDFLDSEYLGKDLPWQFEVENATSATETNYQTAPLTFPPPNLVLTPKGEFVPFAHPDLLLAAEKEAKERAQKFAIEDLCTKLPGIK